MSFAKRDIVLFIGNCTTPLLAKDVAHVGTIRVCCRTASYRQGLFRTAPLLSTVKFSLCFNVRFLVGPTHKGQSYKAPPPRVQNTDIGLRMRTHPLLRDILCRDGGNEL